MPGSAAAGTGPNAPRWWCTAASSRATSATLASRRISGVQVSSPTATATAPRLLNETTKHTRLEANSRHGVDRNWTAPRGGGCALAASLSRWLRRIGRAVCPADRVAGRARAAPLCERCGCSRAARAHRTPCGRAAAASPARGRAPGMRVEVPWRAIMLGGSRAVAARSAGGKALIRGRDTVLGTHRRCHLRIVSGVTRRWQRTAGGSRRTSAANTARSAQSRRSRGLVRRSTATSWRSTRSSTSLVADVRPISRTKPSACRKIKYSSRSDTSGSCLAGDHRWSATRVRLLASHRLSRSRRAGRSPRHGTTHGPLQPIGHIFLNVHESNSGIS